jgi:5-methylcytosine-specific restriction endonuclease McrA
MMRRTRRGGVTGRAAAPAAEWEALKRQAWARDKGRCVTCGKLAHDAHHVKKRSAGGADTLDNIVSLCRRCHAALDAPSAAPVREGHGVHCQCLYCRAQRGAQA